ncbi:hypothetical protein BH24ACI5_BH24ACI5_11590 [soil metagenome]
MGETRVDLQHLLEDLRDAYTGALEETILTEIAANALDSGATTIRLQPDPHTATLTVVDDGRGMLRKDLRRYHDVAASTKSRGEGIGFAGVGIKLALLVADDVVTETRRGTTHVATVWHLATRYRAPWKWITPPGLSGPRGTAIRIKLANPLSPLLDAGYLEEAIRAHFEPLLDPAFDDLVRRHYPRGIVFEVDGQPLARKMSAVRERVTVPIRLGRRRLPSAVAVLERHAAPLSDDRHGIAISTYGKVIRRGWDWLGLAPAAPFRITGLVEAPDLAACLTLSKNDFIRSGPRGAAYLAYRKAIQEVVTRQLTAWGDTPDTDARPRTVRLERDLERVLEDLADDFPLLRSLVDQRAGGQKRLPLPGRGDERVPGTLVADFAAPALTEATAGGPSTSASEPSTSDPASPASEPAPPSSDLTPPASKLAPSSSAPSASVPGRRRPARYGLLVQFESRPGDSELGRLVDTTIWINDAHPAYGRAAASRSAGYHTALTVALALAPLAVAASEEHAFVTQFLAHWGGADRVRPAGRASRNKKRPVSR